MRARFQVPSCKQCFENSAGVVPGQRLDNGIGVKGREVVQGLADAESVRDVARRWGLESGREQSEEFFRLAQGRRPATGIR